MVILEYSNEQIIDGTGGLIKAEKSGFEAYKGSRNPGDIEIEPENYTFAQEENHEVCPEFQQNDNKSRDITDYIEHLPSHRNNVKMTGMPEGGGRDYSSSEISNRLHNQRNRTTGMDNTGMNSLRNEQNFRDQQVARCEANVRANNGPESAIRACRAQPLREMMNQAGRMHSSGGEAGVNPINPDLDMQKQQRQQQQQDARERFGLGNSRTDSHHVLYFRDPSSLNGGLLGQYALLQSMKNEGHQQLNLKPAQAVSAKIGSVSKEESRSTSSRLASNQNVKMISSSANGAIQGQPIAAHPAYEAAKAAVLGANSQKAASAAMILLSTRPFEKDNQVSQVNLALKLQANLLDATIQHDVRPEQVAKEMLIEMSPEQNGVVNQGTFMIAGVRSTAMLQADIAPQADITPQAAAMILGAAFNSQINQERAIKRMI